MVQKQIEEDKVHQLAIMNLAVEYDNACTSKDELQNAYEKCTDIPQEKRVLIDAFLKQESNKDYEMHNALFRKAAKIEHKEALRETLEEEEARAEKEWEERIRQEQAHDELFRLEFRVQCDSESD
ncbi:hypothetical protein Tco_0882040 [Tanacetum coccineum]